MIADKVVDASAIAAVLFNEPQREQVESRLLNATCHAPAFIDVELASVCLKKMRLNLYPKVVLLRMYSALDRFAIARLPVNLTEAIVLAENTKTSLYDASYLWLARSMGVELVTLDLGLARAASMIE